MAKTKRSSGKRRRSTKKKSRRSLVGLVGLENKYHDTGGLNKPFGNNVWTDLTPTTANCLNAIPQGDTGVARDGRVAHLSSLEIRGTILFIDDVLAGSGDEQDYVRIVVVKDTQNNNQASITAASVFQTGTVSGRNVIKFAEIKNNRRYRILKDMVIKQPNKGNGFDGTSSAGFDQQVPFHTKISLGNMPVHYTANTPSCADILDNGIFLLGCSAVNADTLFTYNCRIRFKG